MSASLKSKTKKTGAASTPPTMTSVTDQDTPALNDTSLSTASVQNAPQQGTHRSNYTNNNIDESASFPPSTSTTFKTSITRQTTDMNATTANSALDSEEDDSGDNEDKGSELLGDDFELPTIDGKIYEAQSAEVNLTFYINIMKYY